MVVRRRVPRREIPGRRKVEHSRPPAEAEAGEEKFRPYCSCGKHALDVPELRGLGIRTRAFEGPTKETAERPIVTCRSFIPVAFRFRSGDSLNGSVRSSLAADGLAIC